MPTFFRIVRADPPTLRDFTSNAAAGSAVGEYNSEAAALADVAEAIQRNGRQSVATFGLLRVTARGRGRLVVEGDALADRALTAARQSAGARRSVESATVA